LKISYLAEFRAAPAAKGHIIQAFRTASSSFRIFPMSGLAPPETIQPVDFIEFFYLHQQGKMRIIQG
jgi:hypothetical protein